MVDFKTRDKSFSDMDSGLPVDLFAAFPRPRGDKGPIPFRNRFEFLLENAVFSHDWAASGSVLDLWWSFGCSCDAAEYILGAMFLDKIFPSEIENTELILIADRALSLLSASVGPVMDRFGKVASIRAFELGWTADPHCDVPWSLPRLMNLNGRSNWLDSSTISGANQSAFEACIYCMEAPRLVRWILEIMRESKCI